jgi:hypothetical protein
MYAQIFWIGADVMGANISWAQIFYGRRYFMGADILMGTNISWARIFHGRLEAVDLLTLTLQRLRTN